MQDWKMQQRVSKRVILFPVPLQGHITPMLQLGNILYSRGFSISIIHTRFNSPNPAHNPHFNFYPIRDGLLESEASATKEDIISLIVRLNVTCVAPLRDCLSEMLQSSDEEPVVCLMITDAMLHFCQDVANDLKIPRMVLRTGGVCSFVAFLAFPLLRQLGYVPIQDTQFEEPVPELPPLKVKDIPRIKTRNQQALYELLTSMVRETKASSGLIFNSFLELERTDLVKIQKECSDIPIYTVGPFNKQVPDSSTSSLLVQDQSSISWLNAQAPNSVLYVSFGSIAGINRTEFQEIALALANSNQPFMWVVRPDLVRGSNDSDDLQFPHGYFEMIAGRGLLVQWAPQQEVLRHPATGGFWTHSGWNSTLESISHGVTMICMPCFGDQMVNARYVIEVWRIGVGLENGRHKIGDIETAIRRLMVEKQGEEMRERIACLKDKAGLCLVEGGSSVKSLDALARKILTF